MHAPPRDQTAFELAQRRVGAWLRQRCTSLRRLDPDQIRQIHGTKFTAGWTFPATVGGLELEVQVLLPVAFPHQRAMVAVPKGYFLTWPHVESDGLVCLPAYRFTTGDPVANVKDALANTFALVEGYASGGDAASEFKREFLSYWGQAALKTKFLLSIFDPSGPARMLRTDEHERFIVIADSKDGLRKWLTNMGLAHKKDFGFGLYLPLSEPIVPPYPTKPREFMEQVRARLEPAAVALTLAPSVRDDKLHIVLRADVDQRRGLFGATVGCDTTPKLGGFRKGKMGFQALTLYGGFAIRKTSRADVEWVHGRDANPLTKRLANARVTILGCGAIGSHVAVRLAQAGVGAFELVDPDTLETANVGRHALGMKDVGRNKAAALATLLQSRFPHLHTARAHESEWHRTEDRERLFDANVVVSTIGEAAPELLLNETHLKRRASPPVVYGWMEERAAAAHALAVVKPTHCLRCLIDGDGGSLSPETHWHEDAGALIAEPACGTFFQPFGPIELAHAEAIVADLVVDVLSEKLLANAHRVYTTTTCRLAELGGQWTKQHLAIRPPDWCGGLQFDRKLPSSADCRAGLHE